MHCRMAARRRNRIRLEAGAPYLAFCARCGAFSFKVFVSNGTKVYLQYTSSVGGWPAFAGTILSEAAPASPVLQSWAPRTSPECLLVTYKISPLCYTADRFGRHGSMILWCSQKK